MASQISGVSIIYSTIYSGADQRKHQSSASLAFVRGIHRWPVNSPHKGPVTWNMFPFDDVIVSTILAVSTHNSPSDSWKYGSNRREIRTSKHRLLQWLKLTTEDCIYQYVDIHINTLIYAKYIRLCWAFARLKHNKPVYIFHEIYCTKVVSDIQLTSGYCSGELILILGC